MAKTRKLPSASLTQKASRSHPKVLVGMVIILFVLVGTAIFFAASHNNSLYSPDKNTIRDRATSIVTGLKLSGEEVYAVTQDKGCQEGDIGWLGTHTECTFDVQKYVKGHGDGHAALLDADKQLRALGLEKDVSNSGSNLDTDSLLTGRKTESVHYKSTAGLSVYLGFYAVNGDWTGTPKEYFNLSNDVALGADEYVYGVKVYAPYWSCSVDSWIAPCPAPPSPAKRQ